MSMELREALKIAARMRIQFQAFEKVQEVLELAATAEGHLAGHTQALRTLEADIARLREEKARFEEEIPRIKKEAEEAKAKAAAEHKAAREEFAEKQRQDRIVVQQEHVADFRRRQDQVDKLQVTLATLHRQVAEENAKLEEIRKMREKLREQLQ